MAEMLQMSLTDIHFYLDEEKQRRFARVSYVI
jgi:hypothetical protein